MKSSIKAPAKINLCLRVNSKRADGYHDLSMIMQSVSLFDTLEFEILSEKEFNIFNLFLKFNLPIKISDIPKVDFDFLRQFFNKKNIDFSDKQIILRSNYSYIPTDDRNLVVKIVKYIYDTYDIKDRIFINLKKMIPTSGGLGGGSSDAASMLLFLNNHYKLKLSVDELSCIAAKFGSDIPFFIHKKESICEGRGEIVTELKPFNSYYIVLATPNVRVSTKDIFERIDEFVVSKDKHMQEQIAFDNCVKAVRTKNLKLLANNMFNDLEIVTESVFSDVSNFKKMMNELGAVKSMMSGSGPTVFGIFNSFIKAINCKNVIKKEHKDVFVFICRPIN